MKFKAPLTTFVLAATIIVSVSWLEGSTSVHAAVRDLAFYDGTQFTKSTVWRMVPGAFLVVTYKELVPGLLGLGLSLFLLERRIGWLRSLVVVMSAHIGATVLAGLFLRTGANDLDGLATPDIGSSVVMLSSAAAYSFVARSRKVAALVVVGLLIDVGVNHDLATTEHLVGVAIGVAVAASLRLRSRQGL